ncbi:MAG: sulfur carrier protein ThiS [Brevinematia bacterium]
MKITVNGQQKEVISDNLKEIIETLGFDVNNYVVILNDEIVPKSKLIETRIKENDSIEILTIMGGG